VAAVPPIFSLAGKKSSVALVPDRQPLGAVLFKKLDNRVLWFSIKFKEDTFNGRFSW